MSATTRRSRLRLIVATILIVAVGGLVVVGAMAVKRAQHAARILSAWGRLCQMRFALEIYEDQHGTLPPLCLRNDRGEPIHSWRALIVPHVEMPSLKRLNLLQPWNSDYNRGVADEVPRWQWNYFARDAVPDRPPIFTHILAFLGTDSMWDEKTGLPRGKLEQYPDAILLISVPESTIHPLEPRDISEAEVRALIEEGKEVLFVKAAERDGYGVVKLEGGRLICVNHRRVYL